MSNVLVVFADLSLDEKRAFLRQHFDKKVVMDFSFADPNPFYLEFPNLIGSFPGFFAIDGKCELHMREECPDIDVYFAKHGLRPVPTAIAGLGFTVPRTLATIINEAYFALEDQVASASDIDRAMRFGVNYPQGPFSWAQGKEQHYLRLLDALLEQSEDSRYLPSKALRSVI